MNYRSLSVVVLLAGCGLFEPGDGHGDGYDGGEDDGIEMTTADNEDPGEAVCACAEDNDGIYLLSDEGKIWSFDPDTLEFRFRTRIECGEMSTDTISMGVSRKGRAWVEYDGGDIYTVDLTRHGAVTRCQDPGFASDDPLFERFGMAFVGDGAEDRCDRLYLHTSVDSSWVGERVGALGVVDPQTLELARIAPVDSGWAELTGTRDGRLFAFGAASPSVLSEYDKRSGRVLGRWPLPGIGDFSAFAFAFWGGYFYFFTDDAALYGRSRVTKFDFADLDGQGMVLSTVVAQAPMRIVGAGVSTCAPQCPRSWRSSCSL